MTQKYTITYNLHYHFLYKKNNPDDRRLLRFIISDEYLPVAKRRKLYRFSNFVKSILTFTKLL